MAAHSKIGASSAKRWMSCPGSVKLSEGYENKSSAFAEEGTRAHEYAEKMLDNKGVKDGAFDFDDPEMEGFVQIYVDYVLSLEGELHIEHRFHLKKLHEDLFGTSDAVVWQEDTKTLHVIDLKYGAGVAVEVNDNPQLLYYAVGALFELGYKAERVVATIVQPRCAHPDGPIRSLLIDTIDLLDWSADLLDAVKRVEEANDNPTAYLAPGDYCRWCLAAPNCPSLQAKAQEVSKLEFGPTMSYSPEQLAETLNWLPILEGWIKSVREFAYGEAEHGRTPPGWKLVQKRATRKWASEARAIEWLKNEHKLLDDEMYDFKLKSVAQLEKSVFAKDYIPLELITKESSGYTLAPESDGRPAAKASAADDFAS